jgi:hypothetical protein
VAQKARIPHRSTCARKGCKETADSEENNSSRWCKYSPQSSAQRLHFAVAMTFDRVQMMVYHGLQLKRHHFLILCFVEHGGTQEKGERNRAGDLYSLWCLDLSIPPTSVVAADVSFVFAFLPVD